MKWLTTILSLYLLGLALWPCADEFPASAGPESHAVLTTSDAPPGTSHQDHDQCTPFCTCTCCAVAITVVPNFSYALIPFAEPGKAAAVRFSYEPMRWAAPYAAVWQPPQIRV